MALTSASAAAAQADVKTQLLAFGFDGPTAVRPLPGHPDTYVVSEQGGLLRLVQDGLLLPTPYLDLSAETSVSALTGMSNIIFHPDYETNGYIYAVYSITNDTVVLRRFERSAADPLQADPATQVDIVGPISVPAGFHSGSGMAWASEGTLWVTIGDQRDVPGVQCEAQLGTSLLGKLLRINDDGSIPANNPFVGDPTVLDEVVAWGLRQPWRIDLDPATEDMYIVDVGESNWEEINLRPAGSPGGENYGWRVLEGPDCTGGGQCAGISCPPAGYVAPLLQYHHGPGAVCITGGIISRDPKLPSLNGHFVYSDFLGTLNTLRWDGAVVAETLDLTSEVAPGAGLRLDSLVEVARDIDGSLLLVDHAFGVPGAGEIYRLVPDVPTFSEVTAGLPGDATPTLDAHGTLGGKTWLVFDAELGPSAPTCFWVASTGLLNAPFKGGILGPTPDLILPVAVNAGSSHVEVMWPAGVPSGAEIFIQAWIADGGAPKGFAASPTLRGTTP